jgi:ABC-type sugar transport system permease subunit
MVRKKMSALQKEEALKGYLYLLPNFLGFLVFTAIPIPLLHFYLLFAIISFRNL